VRWADAAPYGFIAPFFVLFAVFGLVPVGATVWLSLWQWNPIGAQHWIGGENFAALSADPRFWIALRNTVAILIIATVPQLLTGLVLAHVINAMRLRFASVVRTSLLIPYVTSGVAITVVVAQVVDKDYGLLTSLLASWGADPVDLLAHPFGAWIVVAAMVAWRWFGFTTLLMVTMLAAVPRELFAAAEIDGAGWWAQFRHLTIPLLRPAVLFTIVTSIVGAMQLFTEPLLLQPGSTTCGPARQCQTLALLVYELGFREFRFGYASALVVVVFMITLSVVGIAFAAGRPRRGER
jgi:cellobiose transport system permease protein